jgi:hypothetical protein
MKRRKAVLSIPPSFVEVERLARYYAKGRGIPFSAFVWQAVEHYLREQISATRSPNGGGRYLFHASSESSRRECFKSALE